MNVTSRRQPRREASWMARAWSSQALREQMFDAVPAARDDLIVRRWVIFAMTTTRFDNGTGRRLLSQGTLKAIWGRGFSSGESGNTVIAYLQACLPRIELASHIPARRCRLVLHDGLPGSLWTAFQEELELGVEAVHEPVYLYDGRVLDPEEARVTMREADQQLAEERLAVLAASDTERYIIKHMNARPRHIFTKMAKRVPEARAHVMDMKIRVKLRDPSLTGPQRAYRTKAIQRHLRCRYLRMLREIELQPQPFYSPSKRERTDRIFPVRPGILALPGDVRRILTADLVREVDLQSAHLAICAGLWECTTTQAFLEEERSIWDSLAEHLELNVEQLARNKKTLKGALYSIAYGMQRPHVLAKVQRLDRDEARGAALAERFATHPIIDEVFEARDRAMADIEARGYALTADGRKVSVSVERDARSVLATMVQSYEMEIMRAIVEFDQEHAATASGRHFGVALWQHDGCAIRVSKSKAGQYFRKLDTLVRARARRYGVATRLTMDK